MLTTIFSYINPYSLIISMLSFRDMIMLAIGLLVGWNLLPQPTWVASLFTAAYAKVTSLFSKTPVPAALVTTSTAKTNASPPPPTA